MVNGIWLLVPRTSLLCPCDSPVLVWPPGLSPSSMATSILSVTRAMLVTQKREALVQTALHLRSLGDINLNGVRVLTSTHGEPRQTKAGILLHRPRALREATCSRGVQESCRLSSSSVTAEGLCESLQHAGRLCFCTPRGGSSADPRRHELRSGA